MNFLLLFSFSGIDDPTQKSINGAIVDTINGLTGNFRINRRLENSKYLLLSFEIMTACGKQFTSQVQQGIITFDSKRSNLVIK